jgi:DNA-binding NarL/FixJ family response regulator
VISVVIADDQALVRSGLRMILDAQPDINVVGEAADGREAVSLVRESEPNVVLMDIRMPEIDGIGATRLLTRRGVATRILVLTTFDLDEYVYEALRAGASGFLLKDVATEDLVAAVRTVARGDALLAPAITRRLIEEFLHRLPPGEIRSPTLSDLTDREVEVLSLIGRGLSNAEIATTLFVAETTVKTHVGQILRKLSLRDRVQAVVLAYETGLARPGRDSSEAEARRKKVD